MCRVSLICRLRLLTIGAAMKRFHVHAHVEDLQASIDGARGRQRLLCDCAQGKAGCDRGGGDDIQIILLLTRHG
jgi:hypothetical protein